MLLMIHAKRPITSPARVLEVLGVKGGDRLELEEEPAGFVLRARKIDLARLAPLRGNLPRGEGSFDLETFRTKLTQRTLRN